MSDQFSNLPDIGALAAQDAEVGLAEPSQEVVASSGEVSFDPTDANQALAAALSPEEISALQATGAALEAGQADPALAPQVPAAAPAPAVAPQVAPQMDPLMAAFMQQQQAMMQYMQHQEAQSRALVDSFKAEVAAFRPKEPEKPKSDIELFQEETLRKAQEAVRQAEVAPLAKRLEALENEARQAKIQGLASQRMNEAQMAARQAFGETIDDQALPAVQELTLALAYGYEIPPNQAASLAKNLVSKAVDAHIRSLNKKAQAAANARPAKAPPVPQATVAAGGTGGVAGKLPSWFTQE